jgi:hypothetical protein
MVEICNTFPLHWIKKIPTQSPFSFSINHFLKLTWLMTHSITSIQGKIGSLVVA